MWKSDQNQFVELLIRGRDYDPRMFGVQSVIPPRDGAPYWEIGFEDGSTLVTSDVITFRFRKAEIY